MQTSIDNNNNSGKDQPSNPVDQKTIQPLKLTDFFGTPEPIVAQPRAATVGQVTTSSKLQNLIPFAVYNDISENAFSDQHALFERLQSITGAQPVGVTRDIAGVGEQGVRDMKVGNRAQQPVDLGTSVDPAVSRENNQIKVLVGETRAVQMVIGKPGGDQALSSDTGGNQMLVEKLRGDRVLNGESREYQGRQPKQRRRGKVGRRRTVDRKHPKEELENDGRQGKQLSFVKAPRSQRKKKSNFVRKKRNKAKVVTVDRYRYENEDGSITWGYKNDDGGFKVIFFFFFLFLLWLCCVQEETIGKDCVTHGKYGYTNSYGEKREYSYSSGVRCHPETRKVRLGGNWGSRNWG